MPVKQRGSWHKIFSNKRRKIKQHSSHLRKIGACLRHQILNLRNENLLSTPERPMHMISKKDLSSAEMDTLTKSCSPTIVITANGEVQTHEEAIVYVKKLDIFSTMKVLEDTPAVLIARKALRWRRIFLTNGSTVKNHISLKTVFYCSATRRTSFVVPGLSACSSLQFSLFNINDTFKAGDWSSQVFLKFIYLHKPWLCQATVGLEAREDLSGIDSHPASVSSSHVERKERGDPLTKPTKNPKPNKNEDHDFERSNPLCSDIPEWLQEFTENLVDDGVPERRDSHASSCHEPSLEPTPARSVDLVKHSVYTHFPKDWHCEICQRTKITRAPCRRRIDGAVPSAEIFDDLITADHKVLSEWCESRNNSSICNRCAGLCHPMDPAVFVPKQKLLRKHKGACKSSWSRIGSPKSFTLTIPWNLAKLVKIFPGIIVRRHHTDRKQIGLLREQCAEWKEGHLQYCSNQVWMKIGRQIPWNAIPICETSQISCLMGRPHMSDVLGNHWKDRSFLLIHWLSITLFLRKTSQESINLEKKKSFLDCSLDALCTWVGIWKGDILVADVEGLETMDASEIYSRRLNAKEVIFPKENGKCIFPVAGGRITHFLEEIRNWEHPPWYETTQFET